MPHANTRHDPHANLKPGDKVAMEATALSDCWAVRPAGQLGTMGWHPVPWDIQFVTAPSAEVAIAKARPYYKG